MTCEHVLEFAQEKSRIKTLCRISPHRYKVTYLVPRWIYMYQIAVFSLAYVVPVTYMIAAQNFLTFHDGANFTKTLKFLNETNTCFEEIQDVYGSVSFWYVAFWFWSWLLLWMQERYEKWRPIGFLAIVPVVGFFMFAVYAPANVINKFKRYDSLYFAVLSNYLCNALYIIIDTLPQHEASRNIRTLCNAVFQLVLIVVIVIVTYIPIWNELGKCLRSTGGADWVSQQIHANTSVSI